jgi:hypothetical protein
MGAAGCLSQAIRSTLFLAMMSCAMSHTE